MADYDIYVTNMDDVGVDSLPPVHVASLPNMNISQIGAMGPLTVGAVGAVGPVTLAGIPDHYNVAISQLPDLNLRIKEIPNIRAHVPANFRLGFSVFGIELAALHLCGEAQIITEPYVPNPCERCGTPPRQVTGQTSDVAAVLRLKG